MVIRQDWITPSQQTIGSWNCIKERVEHGTISVITKQTRSHLETIVQFKVTAWTPKVIHSFCVLWTFQSVFTAEVYHVGYSGNKYSVAVDGVLAGGRVIQTGRQPCNLSVLYPFTTKYNGPNDNSDAPQLAPYCHKKPYHDLIFVFDLELAQSMDNRFFSETELAQFLFGSMPPERLFKMQTFGGQIIQ